MSEATLRKAIKDIRINEKTLDTIVINIDQLNRAKNGRVFTWNDGDAEKAPEL